VPYVWADIDPAGGGSAGFDCSGLVVWAYAQVDIDLPHNSEAIRQDYQITRFGEKAKVKPGDVVFFHTDDRNGPDAASHIAICLDPDRMVVAPHTGGVVEREDISSVPGFMSYGFVREVTGTH
jgi:cell wall-associated NlpC family hydrolase